MNHPIALLRVLSVECGINDSDVLTAALLHDYLEDCCGDKHERLDEGRECLRQAFGEKLLSIVEEVTDDKTLDKQVRKLNQIAKAAGLSEQAKLVKLADKIANLRDVTANPPQGWSVERRREYFDWAQKVVDEMRGTHDELERLFDIELERKSSLL